MSRRILFLVNGLGLGNSTRCHAVMQGLLARGATIEVVTSDNGLWFFADSPGLAGVTAIPSLSYGATGGRISIGATLAQAHGMLTTLRRAERVIAEAIRRFRPHAVVSDSVYALRPVRRAGIPLAALNNADMVMRGMRRFRDWPASVLPQFLVVELADCLLHRLAADLVISPRLDAADDYETASLRRVGPIVREECSAAADRSGPPRRVVVMLSGSVFGSPVQLRRPHPGLTIDVVGRPAPAGHPPAEGVAYHGKIRDSLALLRQADLVVVNGGFSAVSEALVLNKPMVVVPVPRHAEQWVNGRMIQQLGIGTTATEADLEDAMERALAQIDSFRAAYRRLPPVLDGAAQAAELILDLADRP